jgi:hypothetical protein
MATDNEMKTLDYGAFLADLEAKRAVLDQAIASLRAVIAGGTADGVSFVKLAANIVNPPMHNGEVPTGAFLGKSIPEAAKLCLQIVKRKLTSREIADYLKKGGIETTAKSFPALVHSILIRASKPYDSPIVKLDRSYWGLAEWYPAGMRTAGTPEKRSYKRRKVRSRKSDSTAEPKQKDAGPGPVSRITQVLRSKPGSEFSVEDIATPANVSVRVTRLMLGRLIAGKQAEKTAGGKYRAIQIN